VSIQHISYLVCDICGDECTGSDTTTRLGGAAHARRVGAESGWTRIDGQDICWVCSNPTDTAAASIRRALDSLNSMPPREHRVEGVRHGGGLMVTPPKTTTEER
jgi:hypothetical protein